MKGIIDISKKEERELIKLAQAGNRDVLNSLLVSYMPFIEKRAMKYVSYGMEKDDLVQEGLIWLSDFIMSYADEKVKTEFRLFVYSEIEKFFQRKIAKNMMMPAREFRRKISNNEEIVSKVMSLDDAISEIDKEELLHGKMDPVFDEVELGCINDYIDILEQCGELSERQVKIIQLYHGAQMSFQDIGKLMGCSKQAISNNYNRTLKKLVSLINYVPNVPTPYVESEEVKKPLFDWNNVWMLLENVPMSMRAMEMLWLYYEDGLSYNEVALRCGVTVSHVHEVFTLWWIKIEKSPVKEALVILFDSPKTIKDGFDKRRKLENSRRKQKNKR